MHANRNASLDALRGFAILSMVLSGSIAFGGVLPAWMYHAQVPPPGHTFNPAVAGITWVDLVFPFFLFSMGAAIPLALKKYCGPQRSARPVLVTALRRFVLLAFFALFTQHMKAWVIAPQPGAGEHLLSLLAFALLFVQFYENKNEKLRTYFTALKAAAFAAALFLLWKLPFRSGAGFSWYNSDIIIMVLANMALFGTLLYYYTAGRPLLRVALLPFIVAIFLAAKEPGDGWAKAFFNFSHIGAFHFDWLYKFYFLKYLFIVVPGTLAGEWLMARPAEGGTTSRRNENGLALIGLLLVLVNLYGLFTRQLLLNLLLSGGLCGAALYLVRSMTKDSLYRRLVIAGSYLLLLGLFFEACEGGIKKDSSTWSYYFVTSGLAFYTLVLFTAMAGRRFSGGVVRWLALNGKNPMVAYVAGSLLLLPLLELTHTKPRWNALHQNAAAGLLKGLLFTGTVSLVTVWFVKRCWFWKT